MSSWSSPSITQHSILSQQVGVLLVLTINHSTLNTVSTGGCLAGPHHQSLNTHDCLNRWVSSWSSPSITQHSLRSQQVGVFLVLTITAFFLVATTLLLPLILRCQAWTPHSSVRVEPAPDPEQMAAQASRHALTLENAWLVSSSRRLAEETVRLDEETVRLDAETLRLDEVETLRLAGETLRCNGGRAAVAADEAEASAFRARVGLSTPRGMPDEQSTVIPMPPLKLRPPQPPDTTEGAAITRPPARMTSAEAKVLQAAWRRHTAMRELTQALEQQRVNSLMVLLSGRVRVRVRIAVRVTRPWSRKARHADGSMYMHECLSI